jgi:glycosyltransferase involved in cell wall biosynthesis
MYEKNMQNASLEKPIVSIIVGITPERGFHSIFDTINSFLPQEGDISFEFIVVDEHNKEREKIFSEKFPWVKLIQIEKLLPVPHLRNIALKEANGEIIAFVHDHVLFGNTYLQTLVNIFSKGYNIVGGPVLNANPGKLSSWVHYFCEFYKWLPMIPEGEINDLPGTNFAYRFELLQKLGFFPEYNFGVENLFHQQAREYGGKLYFSQHLTIAHMNDDKLADIMIRRFQYGKFFATKRKFSLLRRIIYAILSPLIALIQYGKIFNTVKYDSIHLKKFIQCTPLLIITLIIWMAGECIGYLFGKEDLQINLLEE